MWSRTSDSVHNPPLAAGRPYSPSSSRRSALDGVDYISRDRAMRPTRPRHMLHWSVHNQGTEVMEFWTSERHGAVEIATFSNPPYNYLNKPVIDELEQLVEQWHDPSIRAVVLQSRAGEGAGFTQYSVEELYGMASDPALSRYAAAVVRGYKT